MKYRTRFYYSAKRRATRQKQGAYPPAKSRLLSLKWLYK